MNGMPQPPARRGLCSETGHGPAPGSMRDETTGWCRPADLKAPRCTPDWTAAHRSAPTVFFPEKTGGKNKRLVLPEKQHPLGESPSHFGSVIVHREDRAGEQQGGLGDRRAGPRQGARRTPPNSKGHGANTPRGQHSRPRDRTIRDRRHAAPAARREETLSMTRPQGAQGTARTRRPRRLSTDGALRRTQKAIALEGHRRHAPTPHRQHRPPHMLADACRPGHSRQRQSAGAPTTTTNMYMCE